LLSGKFLLRFPARAPSGIFRPIRLRALWMCFFPAKGGQTPFFSLPCVVSILRPHYFLLYPSVSGCDGRTFLPHVFCPSQHSRLLFFRPYDHEVLRFDSRRSLCFSASQGTIRPDQPRPCAVPVFSSLRALQTVAVFAVGVGTPAGPGMPVHDMAFFSRLRAVRFRFFFSDFFAPILCPLWTASLRPSEDSDLRFEIRTDDDDVPLIAGA